MTGRTEVNLGGSDFGDRLSEAGFSLFTGWDTELINGLVSRSKESGVINLYPDDRRVRFPDEEGAEGWYGAKKRIVYSLFSASQLAGAIWFSTNHYAGADRTASIRIYGEHRARGLDFPFASVVHTHQEEELGYDGGIWIEIASANEALRGVVRKLDYVYHSDPGVKQFRARMVRPPRSDR